jgi:hypothetical protein
MSEISLRSHRPTQPGQVVLYFVISAILTRMTTCNLRPGQIREPPPNGTYFDDSFVDLGFLHLSGTNSAASVPQISGERCIA